MLRQVSAGCGLLLAGLLGASYVLGGPMPRAGTPPGELIAFLNAHSDTQEWSWFLASGPALLFGPWFLGVLTEHLYRVNRGARHLVAAGFATALVAGSLAATAAMTWGLFVYLGTQITSPSLILVLAESRHFAEGSIGFPLAGAVIAYSLAARGAFRHWRALAALGTLAAGLQLANGIDDFIADGVTGPLGPAALAAFLAWLGGLSVELVLELSPRLSSLSLPSLRAPEPALTPQAPR